MKDAGLVLPGADIPQRCGICLHSEKSETPTRAHGRAWGCWGYLGASGPPAALVPLLAYAIYAPGVIDGLQEVEEVVSVGV